jgi:SAM-dependent methyltransferase
MRRFWNRRAREDAFYFVDSRLRYRDPDIARFWSEGDADLHKLLEAAGKRVDSADVVLDIGCGLGRLTRALAARASEVWALDVSDEMLNRARRYNAHLSNVHWLLGDGQSLEGMDDESVDGIVSLVVFQHIPDPSVVIAYVAEMGRVLRRGGWAAFQVSNDPRVHRQRGVGERLHRRLSRSRPNGQGNPAWRGSAIDLGELRRVAGSVGLQIDRTVGEGTQFCVIGAHRVEA